MFSSMILPTPPPPQPAVETPPSFPSYLLPSLPRPFRRRRRISSSADSNSTPARRDVPSLSNSPTDSLLSDTVHGSPGSPASPSSSPTTSPFPRARDGPKLTRIQPETIRCSTCGTDFAFYSQIMSKSFTGRYGRAFLIAPPGGSSQKAGSDLINITVGKPEPRNLSTGPHVVSDIRCAFCRAYVGWKYIDAVKRNQQYKIGKFILEGRRTVYYGNWEDTVAGDVSQEEIETKNARGDDDDPERIVFDSSDEDECDDLFAGTWNAEAVKIRRRDQRMKLDRLFG
ncbi:hypothetical protein NPX13_g6239 [Xylaria arbuscula]|uniref:Yippee domain-containing protein n=1 Tax=Xylaria arbuscula TaxID=114810 RepID=A0A9W8ND05_9PEZI|nr:hypothetical protein NPX13_g6239 [Xylaria arbuscula]